MGPAVSGGGGGGVTPATYVSSSAVQFTSTGYSFAFPTGASVGDILLVAVEMGAGGGETLTVTASTAAMAPLSYDAPNNYSGTSSLYWHVLTATEIADGRLTIAGGNTSTGAAMAIYRGATTAALGTAPVQTEDGTSAMTFPGFAPAAHTQGVVAMFLDRNDATPVALSSASWTSHLYATTSYYDYYVLDRLTGYSNASVTFSNFQHNQGAGGYRTGYLVELSS
jgi:hypothetical protein